jgi:hypothetical protein
MTTGTQPITRDDIKAKLIEIQGEATSSVEEAKPTIIGIAAAVGVVVLVGVYLLGRRGGRRRSTVIELRRS